MRLAVTAVAFALLAVAAAPVAAQPADEPRLTAAVGGAAVADGPLHGLPLAVTVGAVVPRRSLWWYLTAAYGTTTRTAPGAPAIDGTGGELRTGPRVIRCGQRGHLCGGAGAELGLGYVDEAGRRHQDLIVDTRVHLLIGFDRAARIGLDLDVGVRGRVPLFGDDLDRVGASSGVVAGIALFVRR